MGHAKARMQEQEALGLSRDSDLHVCADCIGDYALAAFVNEHASAGHCDFCEMTEETSFAAPLCDVVEFMAGRICEYYTHADDIMGWDSEEDRWLDTTYDAEELFDNIGYRPDNNDLITEILSCFDDRAWCDESWPAMTAGKRWRFGWDRFKEVVKHRRRYTFWSMEDEAEDKDHPDYFAIGKVLEEIGGVIRSSGLVHTVKAGSAYWRVRSHGPEVAYTQGSELSPPPDGKAMQANRMSPAGIAMFYGAGDWQTACVETIDHSDSQKTHVSGGLFRSVRNLDLLDLTQLPCQPSFFDQAADQLRTNLGFLHSFVRDMSKPIKRENSAHIDYVPTQAFTEYIRYKRNSVADVAWMASCTGVPRMAGSVWSCSVDSKSALPRQGRSAHHGGLSWTQAQFAP